MYVAPEASLGFGDVFEAEWLFDIYVRVDTNALYRRSVSGLPPGATAWVERGSPTGADNERVKVAATTDEADMVISSGGQRLAIVLTDDCEIDSLAGNREGSWRPRGRIILAGLRKDDGRPLDDLDLGVHRLPAQDGVFPGALVDFNRLFGVQTSSLVDVVPERPIRKIISLDADAKDELAQRFAGHLVRQGPIAAEGAARKLSRILTAGDDAARLTAFGGNSGDWGDEAVAQAALKMADTVEEAWFLSRLSDQIDDVAERTIAGSLGDGEAERRELCRKLAVSMESLAALASDAASSLRSAAKLS